MSESRCCCNCRRNIRTGNPGEISCHCEVDGHYIGYVECFEGWCRRWARENKWDNGGLPEPPKEAHNES